MKNTAKRARRLPALVAVASLMLLAWPQAVRADEPVLEIVQVGGGSSIYGLANIERIGFESDTLLVVQAGGTERYPLESILRINFEWQPTSVESSEDAVVLIKALHLFQNRPNPFSPETRIEFELPQSGRVALKIYAVSGRLVRTLVEDRRAAGSHSVRWDGRDESGRKVASGVYFYNLAADGISESRKMILLP